MTNGNLAPFNGIWLSILLTVGFPVLAQEHHGANLQNGLLEKCPKLFTESSSATSSAITPFIGKNGLVIESQAFTNQSKSVFLAPVSSWGRGENARQLFVLSLRVSRNEEGLEFFRYLIARLNARQRTDWSAVVVKENVIEVPGVCKAIVHPPYYTRQIPMAQGALELEIEIEKSELEIDVAGAIGDVLLRDFNLKSVPRSLEHLAHYDLSTVEGRAAWGNEAFHDWLQSLSSQAKSAINLISGPDYRSLLPFLRGQAASGSSRLTPSQIQSLVSELDAAIERGRLPVPVKLYRATADPDSLEAWERLSTNKTERVEPLSDTAYTFTSLDESFVQSWHRNELKGKGVIVEIQASAGLRAGYVEVDPRDRDYAEIILARGQTRTPIRAYTDQFGVKRLVVTAP